MDAKSKANFINSVASGEIIPCPGCGTSNKADSEFCVSCGAKITAPTEAPNNVPAFEPAKETVAEAVASSQPVDVFAQGLPEWSLEPPQVMVRRR